MTDRVLNPTESGLLGLRDSERRFWIGIKVGGTIRTTINVMLADGLITRVERRQIRDIPMDVYEVTNVGLRALGVEVPRQKAEQMEMAFAA